MQIQIQTQIQMQIQIQIQLQLELQYLGQAGDGVGDRLPTVEELCTNSSVKSTKGKG